MKTEEEIKSVIEGDRGFIISAITCELNNMAYNDYFDTWEANGGMQWFFTMCVELTDEIMLAEGSAYRKWLDYWKNDTSEYPSNFNEVIGDCLDWYHMNKAREIFESRYEKDECTMEQKSELIGGLLNGFDSSEDRIELMNMANAYAKKERERRAKREQNDKLKKIIQDLKSIGADSDTISEINKELGL